ncbi:MAG: DUF5752 family protein [Candidatus Altiarchaeota archaeon]|nr:DUF5752 family protein [Candidatus Altiarchaeota archaeon]
MGINIKHLTIVFLGIAVAGFILKSLALMILSLVALSVFFLYLLYERPAVRFKKVVYNKDTGRFQVLVENASNDPLWIKYAIRAASPAPMSRPVENSEGAEFLTAASWDADKNFDILSEDSTGSIADAMKTTLFESAKTAENDWNFGLQNAVSLTASYQGKDSSKPQVVILKIPLEITRQHPYLRTVGAAQAFVIKVDDGAEAGKVMSLEELAAAARNAAQLAGHLEKGDIQRWVKEVIGDETLAQSLPQKIKEEAEISEILSERIMGLRSEKFTGRHPLLSDVITEHAFQLKTGESTTVATCASIQALRDAILKTPLEAVAFHLGRGNDFANWAANVLGDNILAERLLKIDAKNPEYARLRIAQTLSNRIRDLGG